MSKLRVEGDLTSALVGSCRQLCQLLDDLEGLLRSEGVKEARFSQRAARIRALVDKMEHDWRKDESR